MFHWTIYPAVIPGWRMEERDFVDQQNPGMQKKEAKKFASFSWEKAEDTDHVVIWRWTEGEKKGSKLNTILRGREEIGNEADEGENRG